MQVTGQTIRSKLAETLFIATEGVKKGDMSKDQISAAKVQCTTANSITSCVRAETAARKQLVSEGNVATTPTDIGEMGSMVMA
jgi:hypothetical protein